MYTDACLIVLVTEANLCHLRFSGAARGAKRLGYRGDNAGWYANKQNHDPPSARHVQPARQQPRGQTPLWDWKLEAGFKSK